MNLSRKSSSHIRSQKGRKFVTSILGAVVLLILLFALYFYKMIHWDPSGRIEDTAYICLRPGATIDDVRSQLINKVGLRHPKLFDFYADRQHLGAKLRPGRFAVLKGMSESDIVDLLINGEETPVSFNIGLVRTEEDLVSLFSSRLAMKKDSLRIALNDTALCRTFGDFDPDNIRCLFIPGKYEIYWNSTPRQLLSVMKKSYDKFWTSHRCGKAEKLGLTPCQVAIIASIVEEESGKKDEWGKIARLYINRYHIGMPLQSDPTVKFASGHFELRRITGEYLRTKSPYNTYVNKGLPPGPIRLASKDAIDAVLNAPETKDIYMCAKEDFSGYHNFATSYAQHQQNAKRYQKELDKRGIK